MMRTWRWMGLQIVQTIGVCWAVVAEKLRSLSTSKRKMSTHMYTEGLFYSLLPFLCHTSHWRENLFRSWSTSLKVYYSLSEHILFNSCSLVHKRLVRKVNTLHRDISINNIMMYKPKDESHAPAFDSQGCHIDEPAHLVPMYTPLFSPFITFPPLRIPQPCDTPLWHPMWHSQACVIACITSPHPRWPHY